MVGWSLRAGGSNEKAPTAACRAWRPGLKRRGCGRQRGKGRLGATGREVWAALAGGVGWPEAGRRPLNLLYLHPVARAKAALYV